jgi:mannose-6-phosphate isomerase-like protein (cupin superfamily)
MPSVKITRLKEGVYSDPKTGWSAYPFTGSFGAPGADIRGVHVVSIYPGQVRGNHYHEHANETLFIFSGKGIFYWEEEGALRQHQVEGGLHVITVPPGVRHAFRNTGTEPVYLLAVRDGAFDSANPDVVRSGLVE